MYTVISRTIEDNPQLSSLVKRANQLLEEILGPQAGSVTANWYEEIRDPGRFHFVTLNLSDSTGASAVTPFTAGELTREDYLRARFHRVWGDLLQERSHRQLDLLSGKIDVPEVPLK